MKEMLTNWLDSLPPGEAFILTMALTAIIVAVILKMGNIIPKERDDDF